MVVYTIMLGGLTANCYLLKTRSGFILIDTGRASKQARLVEELERAGCTPEKLNLIILTHGDFDHTGNCAYFQDKFGTKVAMHYYDSGMVEQGDMFWNRESGNRFVKKIVNFVFRITRFRPDLTIDEGFDLSMYGLDAKVLHLPGHSKGSIGILTDEGHFFCGDLFINIKKPSINTIIDEPSKAKSSLEKLKGLNIGIVYPGHGKPFHINCLEN